MEDITGVLNMIVPLVCIAIGIALVVLIVELIRTIKVGRTMLSVMKVQLDLTMVNVKQMTTDLAVVFVTVLAHVSRGWNARDWNDFWLRMSRRIFRP